MSIFCNHKWIDIWARAREHMLGLTFMDIQAECGKCGARRKLVDCGSCYWHEFERDYKKDLQIKTNKYRKFHGLEPKYNK